MYSGTCLDRTKLVYTLKIEKKILDIPTAPKQKCFIMNISCDNITKFMRE